MPSHKLKQKQLLEQVAFCFGIEHVDNLASEVEVESVTTCHSFAFVSCEVYSWDTDDKLVATLYCCVDVKFATHHFVNLDCAWDATFACSFDVFWTYTKDDLLRLDTLFTQDCALFFVKIDAVAVCVT